MSPLQILVASLALASAPPAVELTSEKLRVTLPDDALAKIPPAERADKLCVRVAGRDRKDAVAVMGEWKIAGVAATFAPRFPFQAGVAYELQIDTVRIPFELPKVAAEPAAVTAVYPTAEVLPENLLRLYIHFDRPMKSGVAYSHLKLLGGDGGEIARPFLELNEELWSPDMRRFTLLLDPGRIKRELKPREELGPVLEAGRSYTLVVAAGWKTAEGSILKEERRKKFAAGPAEDRALRVGDWPIAVPAAGTKGEVSIAFDRPLDRALLERVVRIADASGKEVEGKGRVENGERRWLFAPKREWTPGRYSLVVEPVLEDVCGNRPGIPFETRLGQQLNEKAEAEKVGFEIKPPQ